MGETEYEPILHFMCGKNVLVLPPGEKSKNLYLYQSSHVLIIIKKDQEHFLFTHFVKSFVKIPTSDY